MYDVIVVGGGPAGSAAARKCAQHALRTLLLEKHRLPRDKMCTGLLAGDMAQALLQQEFGGLPQEVTVFPSLEAGFMLHIPGVPPKPINQRMPIAWRRDVDYWLNQKALQAGAEIWDSARLLAVEATGQGYQLRVKRGNTEEAVSSRFVIGADGTMSYIRQWLYPQLPVAYAHCYRECFPSLDLPLERDYVHMFFIPEFAPYYFDAYYKEDLVLLEVVCPVGGGIRQLTEKAKGFLAREYGFDLKARPVKVEACTEPILYRGLFSRSFLPARGNVLLVGDAAGLQMPVTAEGIGTALMSGFMAAEAVAQASRSGAMAEKLYLPQVWELVSQIARIYDWTKRIREASKQGPQELATALAQAWGEGLRARVYCVDIKSLGQVQR